MSENKNQRWEIDDFSEKKKIELGI